MRVWDIPTRLFHWLLVGLLGFSWWSAENDAMDWHRLSGIVLLGLLLFRLIWGFAGADTARFASFLRSPGRAIAWLASDSKQAPSPGHNPIGGYSTVLILLLLAVQIVSGLLAVDVDGLESGHLSHLVSFDQSRAAAEVHEIAFTLLQAVAALHVLAILIYLIVRKRNLIVPMITGRDPQLDRTAAAMVPAGVLRFTLAALASAGMAWFVSTGPGT